MLNGGFNAIIMLKTKPYVSKEFTRLEKRLGSRVINRTTRTISLTDAGRAYFERCSR